MDEVRSIVSARLLAGTLEAVAPAMDGREHDEGDNRDHGLSHLQVGNRDTLI